MLFLIPYAMLLMAEGFRCIYWLVAKWKPGFSAIFSGLLALSVVWQFAPITYEKVLTGYAGDLRPSIQYLAQNRMPGDAAYVFYRLDTVFPYYAPLYGLDTGDFLVGSYNATKRETLQGYQDDVLSLVGNQRVWFLFSGVTDCNDCPEEDSLMYYLEYINRFGVITDSYNSSGSYVYLYDLSQ